MEWEMELEVSIWDKAPILAQATRTKATLASSSSREKSHVEVNSTLYQESIKDPKSLNKTSHKFKKNNEII